RGADQGQALADRASGAPHQPAVRRARNGPRTRIPSSPADYRDVAWLGTRQPITVLPSVASLKALREHAKSSNASRSYLGIGNPLLDGPQDHPRWGTHYESLAQAARDNQQCAKKKLPTQIAQGRGHRSAAGFAKMFRGVQADIEEVRSWTPLPETVDE